MHFKVELKDIALELIKTKDNVDIANDILNISNYLTALDTNPTYDILLSAQELDKKMQQKYSIIIELLEAGNQLAKVINMSAPQYLSDVDKLKSYLKQDMYGILCHALIKEKIISKAEQFIDRID